MQLQQGAVTAVPHHWLWCGLAVWASFAVTGESLYDAFWQVQHP